jgi:hypothetical protein
MSTHVTELRVSASSMSFLMAASLSDFAFSPQGGVDELDVVLV